MTDCHAVVKRKQLARKLPVGFSPLPAYLIPFILSPEVAGGAGGLGTTAFHGHQ